MPRGRLRKATNVDFVRVARNKAWSPGFPKCHMCFDDLEEWGVDEAFRNKVRLYVKCGRCKQEEMATFDLYDDWQESDAGWELLRKLMTQYEWNKPSETGQSGAGT